MKYTLLSVLLITIDARQEPKHKPPNPHLDLLQTILTILISVMILIFILLICLYQRGYRIIQRNQTTTVQGTKQKGEKSIAVMNLNQEEQLYNSLSTSHTTLTIQ